MENKLILFSQIFINIPNLQILFIVNNTNFLQTTLEKIVSESQGKLTITKYTNDKLHGKPTNKTREYKYVVLENIDYKYISNNNFLSSVYRSLENSGLIICVLEKKSINVETLLSCLDKYNFVVGNSIDLFDDYYLITAKKTHIWNAGL